MKENILVIVIQRVALLGEKLVGNIPAPKNQPFIVRNEELFVIAGVERPGPEQVHGVVQADFHVGVAAQGENLRGVFQIDGSDQPVDDNADLHAPLRSVQQGGGYQGARFIHGVDIGADAQALPGRGYQAQPGIQGLLTGFQEGGAVHVFIGGGLGQPVLCKDRGLGREGIGQYRQQQIRRQQRQGSAAQPPQGAPPGTGRGGRGLKHEQSPLVRSSASSA